MPQLFGLLMVIALYLFLRDVWLQLDRIERAVVPPRTLPPMRQPTRPVPQSEPDPVILEVTSALRGPVGHGHALALAVAVVLSVCLLAWLCS